MKKRDILRREIRQVGNKNVVGDPYQTQMKELNRLNSEILLELIDTLDKIDESNKELEKQSIELAKSNVNLANKTFWAQIASISIAILALVVALFIKRGS